ncbi:hypothetical protein PG993_005489 [Apiospora rasikravindrae]|uniref:RNase H type-1 domain-containing protein n=1 Tax=Apiospora rasikravindrae TaxID=990691 RepID=A0ABR1TFQ3_9PEZI
MLGQYCGLMASVQNLFDKQSICNNSIGILSGIPRPAWAIPRAQQACDNQPVDHATKQANEQGNENNVLTVSGHAANTIIPAPDAGTPFPLPPRPPTAVGLPTSPFQVDANPAANVLLEDSSTSTAVVPTRSPPARSRSFSDVQADIKSRMTDIGAAQTSRTVTETVLPMGGFPGTIQPVTPQPRNITPQDPATLIMKTQQHQPQQQPPQGKKQQELGSQRVRELVAWDAYQHIPNPRFVIRDTQYDTRVFANECCRARGNPVFGRRLVLFSDGSHCPATRTASAAVVYRRFYDMTDDKTEPPWAKESFGIIRLADAGKFETLALMAALEIVQHEAKVLFASMPDMEPLRVYLFTDSTSAMSDLEQVVTCTIREEKQKKNPHVLHLMKIWRDLQSDVHKGRLMLEVHWVKGHIGAEGNEFADRLAAKTIEVTKKLHFARPASSPLGQGYEVFPLWQMEQDILAQSIIRTQAAATIPQTPPVAEGSQKAEEAFKNEEEDRSKKVVQQDSLGQIRKIFADFFNETRKNSEKQNRHAIDELRKELAKQPKQTIYQQDVTNALKINRADLQEMLRKELSKPHKESPQLEQAIKSQNHNRLAFDELRIEIKSQNLRQEAQDAQMESLMMALDEATSEWRNTLAAQSREIKALRKENEEMLRTLRGKRRMRVKHTGGEREEGTPTVQEEASGDETRSISVPSNEQPAVDTEQVNEIVESCTSSEESRETVTTAFEEALSNVEQNPNLEGYGLVVEEEQMDDTSSTFSSSAEQQETVPDELANAEPRPESADGTATACDNTEELRETDGTAFEAAVSSVEHSDVETESHDVIEEEDHDETASLTPAESAVVPQVIDAMVDSGLSDDTSTSCAGSEETSAPEQEEREDDTASAKSARPPVVLKVLDAMVDQGPSDDRPISYESSGETPATQQEEEEDTPAINPPETAMVWTEEEEVVDDSGIPEGTTAPCPSFGETPAAEQEEEDSPAPTPSAPLVVVSSAEEEADLVDDSTATSFSSSVKPYVTEHETRENSPAFFYPTEPVQGLVGEAEVVEGLGLPVDTVTSCSSSGATMLGEAMSQQSTGSDFRGEDGGKSPGKLRRRDKLLQKLHVRWPGKKKSKEGRS